MKKGFKLGAVAFCVASALALTACGGGSSKSDGFGKKPAPEQSSVIYVGDRPYDRPDRVEVANASDIKVLDYKMKNVAGEEIVTSAVVLFPHQPAPEGGYRVVVWQHGTLGVADACAPSNSFLSPRFKAYLAKALLAEGYVIVAPDYEGLGSKGVHPYLNSDSEALSSIKAVEAAQQKYNLSKYWMSIGQSQGGQASLATAEYLERNGKDSYYLGAVGAAPANSLKEIILEVAPAMLAQYEAQENKYGVPLANRAQSGTISALGTLLAYNAYYTEGLKMAYPDFDASQIFDNPSTYALVKMATGRTGEDGICIDNGYIDETGKEIGLRQLFAKDILKFMQDNPTASILDYPRNNREAFLANKILNEALANDDLKAIKLSVPIMIVQGTADTSVPYNMTERLVGQYIAAGTQEVRFVPVEGATHTEAIVQANGTIVDFVKEKMPSLVDAAVAADEVQVGGEG